MEPKKSIAQIKIELAKAKDKLRLTLLHKVKFDFYHATNVSKIIGDVLLSPAASKEPLPRGMGIEEGRGEQHYVFGWWLPRDSLYADIVPPSSNRKIYIFDGDKLLEHVEVTVKGQDPWFHSKAKESQSSIVWNGNIFGAVHLYKEILPAKEYDAGKKLVTLVSEKGEKREYIVAESEQTFKGKKIPECLALDVIKMVEQIEELDPESALQILEPFTSFYIETNNPEFVEKQQIERAKKLYCQSDLREATVFEKLPFKTISGEELLREIDKDYGSEYVIRDLFEAIMTKDYDYCERVLKNQHHQAQQSPNSFIGNARLPAGTPLICAVEFGYTNIVQLLLSIGVNVNAKANILGNHNYHYGLDALMIAARMGSLPIVKLLLEHDANPAAINHFFFEQEHLLQLIQNGDQDAIDKLFNYRLSADLLGSQVVFDELKKQAVKLDLAGTIRVMHKYANYFKPKNALQYAIDNHHWNIAAYLIQNGSHFFNHEPVSNKYYLDILLLSEITALVRLLCETNLPSDCFITFENNRITFHFKICNNSVNNGVHHAQIPIIPHALGSRSYFDDQDSHHFYHLEFKEQLSCYTIEIGAPAKKMGGAHDHDKFDSLAEIRNRLLEREIKILLICIQNYSHIKEFGVPHSVTGKGATDSTNLLKTNQLINYSFSEITVNDGAILIKMSAACYAEEVALAVKAILQLESEQINFDPQAGNIIFNMSVIDLVERMQVKRINYLGIMAIDEHGRITLAERKNAWESHSMGYASAGGHCAHPYFPELAMLETLEEEFGLTVKDFYESTKAVEIISVNNQMAIGIIPFENLQLTTSAKSYTEKTGSPFMAETDEYLPGTEKLLSISDIRKEKLPLRSLPTLPGYLGYMSAKIQECVDSIQVLAGLKLSFLVDFSLVKKSEENFSDEDLRGLAISSILQKKPLVPSEKFAELKISGDGKAHTKFIRLMFEVLHLPVELQERKTSFGNICEVTIFIEPSLLYQGLVQAKSLDLESLLEEKIINLNKEQILVKDTNLEQIIKHFSFKQEKNLYDSFFKVPENKRLRQVQGEVKKDIREWILNLENDETRFGISLSL